ncbi:MAG: hypothetical protein JSW58_01695, partial [Candidatus Latescibacterota bacterium]
MKTTLAVVALLVSVGFLGQIVSVVNFKLAQRLGLQEKDEATDPVFRYLERNTARWDMFVLWTLPVAAVLMLIEHSWWPYAALLAGGIYIDTGGREAAKILGLQAEGVKFGSASEVRLFFGYIASMTIIGLAL